MLAFIEFAETGAINVSLPHKQVISRQSSVVRKF
jgi:hypothetical protein